MKKRFLSLALALIMALSLLSVSAFAAETLTAATSNNAGAENYAWYYANTVKSYLFDDGEGFTRVEYLSSEAKVVIEQYTNDFQLKSQRFLNPELPVWGGFYAGANYNFLIFGQQNKSDSDDVEVMRVVKYSKSWQRLGQASVYGANTYIPFDAGSLRCAEGDGKLLIQTCHEMYESSDGFHHQANMTYYIDQSSMKVEFSNYGVSNASTGYVSHSFNQFILVDAQGRIITLNHGDAYPRGLIIHQLSPSGNNFFNTVPARNEVLSFQGSIGANQTGCSVGGLEETTSGYVYAYTQNKTDYTNLNSRQVYLGYLAKGFTSSTSAREVQLTTTAGYYYPPQLVSTGLDGGYILWEVGVQGGYDLYYAPYYADGTVGAVQCVSGGRLSDCKPVKCADGVLWYVTEFSVPTFYFLNGDGVKTCVANTTVSKPTAYTSTQNVLVDGKSVEFQCYALKDKNGNDTNYIKLRDIAYILNGTAAQFNVGWDGSVNIETGKAYAANGSEMSTPFSGNRAYENATAATNVNGKAANLSAIVLKDDNGNGYTYYKLRDLGSALGFKVDWSAEKGIFIETK